jgi:hypothetical protein
VFAIGVVAHHARAEAAHALQESVGAHFLSMDNGTLGVNGNHRNVWSYLANQPVSWGVCLEDDCEPVEGFRNQLEQALNVAPAPIVSLYLGDPVWWRLFQERKTRLEDAGKKADDQDACWLTTQELLHGVAVCIQTDLIKPMLEGIGDQAIDYAIREWAKEEGHQIAFTMPSLVDHADGPTLLPKPPNMRDRRRKAWRTGTRDTWTSEAVSF